MRAPEDPVRGDAAVVRRATVSDAELLVAWHADPEVARFWDGEMFTHEEMLERLARPDVDAYIIEDAERPIGYLQAWFDDDLPGAAGMDMFLIPTARDRGLGPDAGRALVDWFLGPGGMDRVTVDPYIANARAVRGWAKAGFEPVDEHEPDEEHTQRWVLMVRRR
jgi:aminoglycoside 6'-N-acetyltransferase